MQIVPINNGYSFIKSDLGLTFKSSYKETSMSQYAIGSDLLTFDGKTYSIGDGVPVIAKDKTENIATKLFVLNMLCKHMDNTNSEHFKVYLTAPPMTYSAQKDALPQYLLGSYKVTYNGKPKDIYIDSVTVYPETIMAYLANNPSRFKRPVLVIDIGGLTTNVAYIKNGICNKDSIVSFTNGMYHIENAVCDFLNDKYWSLELDSSQMCEFLQNGIYIGDGTENIIETQKDKINEIFSQFVEKIHRKITLKKWSPDMCDILVTGGGGKLLFESIKNFYSHATLSKDPIFDNLNGMLGFIARESAIKSRECAISEVK